MKDHRTFNVGDSDYASKKIQPWDVWRAWELNPWDADIVKRICRTKPVKDEDPRQSRIREYEKIKHVCDERICQFKEEIEVEMMDEEHYERLSQEELWDE